MCPDPAAPINLVKEPIHDDEEDDDGKQSGCGLEVKRRHIIAQRTDDSNSDRPRDQSCTEGKTRPNANRASMYLPCTRHACGDCCENKDTLKTLPEYQDSDIQACDRWTRVRSSRVGCALFSDALPDQNGNHDSGGRAKGRGNNRRMASRQPFHLSPARMGLLFTR